MSAFLIVTLYGIINETNKEENQPTEQDEELVEEECGDGPCEEVWKIEEMDNEKDHIKELESFVSTPSVDSLKEICAKAKDVETAKTKEILSSDRTEMARETLSLWEVLPVCEKVKDKNFIFKKKAEGKEDILAEFKKNDTDEVRKEKIKFNERIEKLLEGQEIFGYDAEAAEFINCFLENSCEGGRREGATEFNQFLRPNLEGVSLPVKKIERFLEEYERVQK